jgi:outer membrane protein W
MKKLCIVLGLLFVSSVAAGNEVVREKGDVSLNFSFNGLVISDYKFGIGSKYWLTSDLAVAGSLDTANQENNAKTDYGSGVSTETDSDVRFYGLSLGLEKHFKSRRNLSPYLGVEAQYSKEYGSSNMVQANGASTTIASTDYTTRGYALNAVLGVEYALNKNISLAADYSYGYRYSKRTNTSTDISAPTQEATTKGFSLGSGRLILLVYF